VQWPAQGIEDLVGKRRKELCSAFWIGTLDMGDTLQTERAVVLGVEGVVGLGEGWEMVVEDESRGIRSPRDI